MRTRSVTAFGCAFLLIAVLGASRDTIFRTDPTVNGRQVTQSVRQKPAQQAEETDNPERSERARKAEKQPTKDEIVIALLLLLSSLRQ